MAYCAKQSTEETYAGHFAPGIYECAQCSAPLFHGKSKFQHSSPWPAFTQPVRADSLRKEVEHEPQTSSDKPALKIFCNGCQLEIGHEFLGDGPEGASRF